jgi:hypothetical protein
MVDSKKLTIALTQLEVLRRNIPDEVPEERVTEFDLALTEIESSLGEDLSAFRVPPTEVKPRIASVRRAAYGRPGSGNVTYTKTKYCDRGIFSLKIEGVALYLQKLQPEPAMDSKDYWSMNDVKLEQLATKYNIPPASMLPGGQWYIDRERIINELLKRDRALNPKPQSNKIEIGTMIGSAVQQATSHSVATVNYQVAAPEIKQFLTEVKSVIDKLEISDAAREELRADIQTLDVQFDSRNPKTAIILESLRSVRNILEGAVGGVIAAGLPSALPKTYGVFPLEEPHCAL